MFLTISGRHKNPTVAKKCPIAIIALSCIAYSLLSYESLAFNKIM